jgi:hypothetical protein
LSFISAPTGVTNHKNKAHTDAIFKIFIYPLLEFLSFILAHFLEKRKKKMMSIGEAGQTRGGFTFARKYPILELQETGTTFSPDWRVSEKESMG